jgi:hypothetical protein
MIGSPRFPVDSSAAPVIYKSCAREIVNPLVENKFKISHISIQNTPMEPSAPWILPQRNSGHDAIQESSPQPSTHPHPASGEGFRKGSQPANERCNDRLCQPQRGLYFAYAQDTALKQFYHLHPVGI